MPFTEAGNRTQLIEAAAQALCFDEKPGTAIAGVRTAAFVQSARKAFKGNGFNFTDTDLRLIHDRLRVLVAQRQLGHQVAVDSRS